MYKRLSNVQRSERLTDCTWSGSRQAKLSQLYFRTVIPEILNDGRRLLQPWERAGSFDPFEKIYEVSRLLSLSLPFARDGTCQKRWPSGAFVVPSVLVDGALANTLPILACIPSHRTVSDLHGDS